MQVLYYLASYSLSSANKKLLAVLVVKHPNCSLRTASCYPPYIVSNFAYSALQRSFKHFAHKVKSTLGWRYNILDCAYIGFWLIKRVCGFRFRPSQQGWSFLFWKAGSRRDFILHSTFPKNSVCIVLFQLKILWFCGNVWCMIISDLVNLPSTVI